MSKQTADTIRHSKPGFSRLQSRNTNRYIATFCFLQLRVYKT